MELKDYLQHYLSWKGLLPFLAVSLVVVVLIHSILLLRAKEKGVPYGKDHVKASMYFFMIYTERYYELVFSATSVLFFTGIYFLIDFDYFHLSGRALEIWNKYNGFLLLMFIVISVIMNSIFDHWIIPLSRVQKEEISTLRMTGMLYMLILFAYIKFIYMDDNYDRILEYFLTLVISRFVYFDASIHDFRRAMRSVAGTLPILLLVLLSTALLSLYGFGTGYLLRNNGVVVSVYIAHFFMIMEIFVLYRSGLLAKIAEKIC